MAVDAVVGTPGIVGFGMGDHNRRDEGVYELIASVDRSQHTASILAALRHEASDNTAAVQANAVAIERTAAATNLAIEKTAAAAALAHSECCCEIKTAIRDDGDKTRALVQEIERERLAGLLSDAKNDLLVERIAAARS